MRGEVRLVMPVYLLMDASGSMAGGPIAAINHTISGLIESVRSDPLISEVVRLSIISFSTGTQVVLPLSSAQAINAVPALHAGGGTNLGAAFTALREALNRDIRELKAEGLMVYRPVVFLLSDGMPTDSWVTARQHLELDQFRPTIIAFGIGDADPSAISAMASRHELAYVSDDKIGPDQAIASFGDSVRNVVSAFASSVQAGRPQIDIKPPTSYSVVPDALI